MEWGLLALLIGPLVAVGLYWLNRRRPKLIVRVKRMGGGSQVDFSARVSNAGTAPALDCELTAELEGIPGFVYRSRRFSLEAGELDRKIMFGIERPRYGDLVPALRNETTLYGRRMTVRVACGRAKAEGYFQEVRYDPVTDASRYAAQQKAWERGLRGQSSS